ncbi:hypothetical protein LIA77_08584 [Sarocladium implicatum]|nr:hypothetical protein LIA77_08584 [Sarocladium implicatum]
MNYSTLPQALCRYVPRPSSCSYAAFVGGSASSQRLWDGHDPSWRAPCSIEMGAQTGVHCPISDPTGSLQEGRMKQEAAAASQLFVL